MARFVTFRDSLVLDLDSVTWAQKVGASVRIHTSGQVLEVTAGAEELWPLLLSHFGPTELGASRNSALPSAGHFMVESGPS